MVYGNVCTEFQVCIFFGCGQKAPYRHTNRPTYLQVKIGISSTGRSPHVDFEKSLTYHNLTFSNGIVERPYKTLTYRKLTLLRTYLPRGSKMHPYILRFTPIIGLSVLFITDRSLSLLQIFLPCKPICSSFIHLLSHPQCHILEIQRGARLRQILVHEMQNQTSLGF